jgi:broad-specificity NMP kinase
MLTHQVKSIGKGGSRAVASSAELPRTALQDAKAIRSALRRAGIDPRKAKVGIIATPGTGKSTMARALEKELGVKSINLDKAKSSLKGRRAQNFIDSNFGGNIPQGSVLEQTHMPHGSNMDQFDVVIKLERDADEVRRSILKRGKGAHQTDYIDYKTLQGEINESFNSLNGRHVRTRGGVDIKIRGKGGFQSERGRLNRARELGLDVERFKKLTQAQQLASLDRGKIIKPYGITNSFNLRKVLTDTALVTGGTAGGAMYGYREKTSALSRDQKKKALIGAGLGIGAAAAITLARRPGLRAHLKAKYNTMFSSGEEKALAKLNISGKIPEASVQNARRMIRDLKRQGYTTAQIKKMRIGVVGSTGSGKSSLARAIEQELGAARMSLDEFISYNPLKAGNVNIDAAIKAKGGVKPGTVVEQSQLLHTGDPSHFDVIMKIERPAEDIKRGLIERGHAAVTADYVNISKAQTTVNEAFNTIGGKRRRLGQGVEMIVKPRGGKTAETLRLERARELGLNVEEFSRMSRRDQIQSLANRANRTGQSFRSHISSGALRQDLSVAGGLAVTGGAAGGYMSKESSARGRIDAVMAQIDNLEMQKRAFAGAATAAAVGAVGGGAIGALAGGEGNRGAGFMTGAMLGAGAGLGAAKLTGGLGKLLPGGAAGGTRVARETLAKRMGVGVKELSDDLVLSSRGGAALNPVTGKPLTMNQLTQLRLDAASQPQLAERLRRAGLLEGKVNTAGAQLKFMGDLEKAIATNDPAKIQKAYDSAVKSGVMDEAAAAQQMRYTNPEGYTRFKETQANAQRAANAASPTPPVQTTPTPRQGSAPTPPTTPPPMPPPTPPPTSPPTASRRATQQRYQTPPSNLSNPNTQVHKLEDMYPISISGAQLSTQGPKLPAVGDMRVPMTLSQAGAKTPNFAPYNYPIS